MEQPIGYLIKQITDKIRVSADASLKTKNLTLAQARVLIYISGSVGNKVTQKAIEDYLDVSHPTVVGIVSRMEKNGYLICYADREDKRNKIVELTDHAIHIAHELQSEMAAQEEKLFSDLTEEEVKNLHRMLDIIYRNVR